MDKIFIYQILNPHPRNKSVAKEKRDAAAGKTSPWFLRESCPSKNVVKSFELFRGESGGEEGSAAVLSENCSRVEGGSCHLGQRREEVTMPTRTGQRARGGCRSEDEESLATVEPSTPCSERQVPSEGDGPLIPWRARPPPAVGSPAKGGSSRLGAREELAPSAPPSAP